MAKATLLLYLAVGMAIGIRAKATTLEKFIRGDMLGTRALVATIVSTFYGASAVLGGVSLTYQIGLGVIWFMVPFYLGNIAVLLLLREIADSDRFTLPDFLGDFYGGKFAAASSMLLATLCLVPEEIIAGGKVLSALALIPVELAMGIVAFALVVPVAMGGMKADVITDIVQFALMLLMLIMVMLFILTRSRWGIAFSVPDKYLNPLSHMSVQEMAVFFTLLFFLPITSAPLYQRLFISESEVSARRSIWYSVAVWMAVDSIVVLCGFAALGLFPGLADPDTALILLGMTLPPVGRSIFLVGLLAVITSTVNSFLHCGASSLAYDVFGHFRPAAPERRLLALSRLFVVLLGLVSLILAMWFQMIVPALLFTLTVWTSGILIPTLLVLTGKKLRPDTALYSLLAGTLSSLVWKIVQPLSVDALFVGLGASSLTVVASETVRAHRQRKDEANAC